MATLQRLVLAGALAAVAACTPSQPTAAEAISPSDARVQKTIEWGKCPALAQGATRDPREVCGTVTVPLDYRKPDGRTISVAVSRIATAKPDKRRGYLVLNPGGPALEGLDTPTEMAAKLSPSVLDAYDLIGFDPRGVGHSTPQSCALPSSALAALFPYPGPDGSIQGNVETAQTVAKACTGISADLRFYNTANTARDMDRIRDALGTPKISYWGQSYGTYLGAVYAELFPQHVDRMVTESNVDPNRVWQQFIRSWSQGMDDRFPDAARVAAANKVLGTTVEQVRAGFIKLTDQLDRKPVTVPGTDTPLAGATVRAITYQSLLHNEALPLLTQFWQAAADIAAGKPLTAADKAALAQIFAESPAEPGVPADNQATMTLSILCGDTAWPRDVDGYAAATADDRKRFPLSAGMPANILPCAFWPYEPIEKQVTIGSDGPRNILMLQNRRDNATPWDAAQAMRKDLGDRAGFVGADNGGHYVYKTGSSCADQATDAFLTQGTLPASDLSC